MELKDSVPLDPADRDPWIARRAHTAQCPTGTLEAARRAEPGDRIKILFVAGICDGAVALLRRTAQDGLSLPGRISAGDPEQLVAWACKLANSVTVPPRGVFADTRMRALPTIYRAGVREGLRLTLAALPTKRTRRYPMHKRCNHASCKRLRGEL
jgi:hypothetical protein